MPEAKRAPSCRFEWGDVLVCGLLAAGTALYVNQWPRDLNGYDEGLFLYEAERILAGKVMYRDFFEVAAPAPFYVMALLFKLFGANIETARAGMTVLHTLIVALLYATCRRLGIRRSVAAFCAAAHPVLFFPAFPIASPHWFGTLLGLLALCLAARAPIRSPARAAALGAVIGACLLTQHQKAPIIGFGAVLLIAWDNRDAWRSPTARSRPFRSWLAFAGGAAAVAIPCLSALLAVAGPKRVYDLLVLYPLTQYPGYHRHVGWGYFPWLARPGIEIDTRALLLVYLMKFLPAAAIIVAARSSYRAAYTGGDAVRPAVVAVLFAAVASLSVAYNPDFVHLAMVGPLWIAPVALLCEWTAGALEGFRSPFRHAGAVAAGGLALLMAEHLSYNLSWRYSYYPHRHDTAFGRIDFHDPDEVVLVDAIRERSRTASSRELFVFPAYAALYLMTGTINPTPYQILVDGYSVPRQFEEVVDILENRKVPLVAYSPWVVRPRKHLVARYVVTHYDRVALPMKGRLPVVLLYERKDADGDGG